MVAYGKVVKRELPTGFHKPIDSIDSRLSGGHLEVFQPLEHRSCLHSPLSDIRMVDHEAPTSCAPFGGEDERS